MKWKPNRVVANIEIISKILTNITQLKKVPKLQQNLDSIDDKP